MSTNSTVAWTSLRLLLISASASSRGSGTWATPTVVSVVENGWAATGADPPVRALNRLDLPELGRPTMPRRSIGSEATGPRLGSGPCRSEPRRRRRAPIARRPTTAASPTGAASRLMASVVALHVADAPSVWEARLRGRRRCVPDRLGERRAGGRRRRGHCVVVPGRRLAGRRFGLGGRRCGLGGRLGGRRCGPGGRRRPRRSGDLGRNEAAAVGSSYHPNGVVAIDHIVVSTPDLERTIAAFDEAGLLLRRRRDAGATYGTALHRRSSGSVRSSSRSSGRPSRGLGTRARPASSGWRFTVADLDETASYLGRAATAGQGGGPGAAG